MSRKPTFEDALLLAFLEAGAGGLDIVKWHYFNKPDEFEVSLDSSIKKVDSLVEEGFVDSFSSGSEKYKITEKGKFEAHNIGDKINSNDYISLIARFSPEVEIKKRVQNIETFLISILGVYFSFSSLESLLKTQTNISVNVYFPILASVLIMLIVALIYLYSSFTQIVDFWAYYSLRYGKASKFIFNFYKNYGGIIKTISRFIILPLITLLIVNYGLDMSMNYAVGTLFLTIVGQLILPKQK